MQWMSEKIGDAPNCRKTEAEAACAIAFWIVQLIELFEDAFMLLGRNAHAGVPDFDDNLATAFAARDQDAALIRVADRIRHQVREDTEEQRRIRCEQRA